MNIPFLSSIGQYNKFIVAVLGAIAVGITTFGGSGATVSTVLSAISAISVWLVPNAAKAIAPPAAPAQPTRIPPVG